MTLTLFFDLDGTLYPNENGMWPEIKRRIGTYMTERMGIPEAEAARLREHYLLTCGTTLRGLQRYHNVDSDDFLAYVHDLPLERYLTPDPALRPLLMGLQARRWIFTNADAAHARRVLRFLHLEDCFEGIIDVHALGWMAKPEVDAYHRARALAGNPPPKTCILLDDSVRNTAGARQAGWHAVLIGPHPDPDAADMWAPALKAWLRQKAEC
ncbi:MAG: pyrimidine 5'-nucleotidase [Anaerolineales bacterium]